MSSFKIVLVGNTGVGKSALCVQFVQHVFEKEYDPTIEDSYTKRICLNQESYVLELIDTSGDGEFSCMRDQSVRLGQGFMIVFAVNDQKSFEDVNMYIELITKLKNGNVAVILVGNKTDLTPVVEAESIERLASYLQIHFMTTTARNSKDVDCVFHTIVAEMQQRKEVPMEKNDKLCSCILL
ncbi:GTPase HRas [Mizuhopecten yessoensis]|uniref:GTPase HRas n=1 Tax=Mizuhopecten yessoensis TaxID=6573 RepID=A0A210PYZ2_MIZYE|nr:GTPase HRas [Mizuhopecten yessoensis]